MKENTPPVPDYIPAVPDYTPEQTQPTISATAESTPKPTATPAPTPKPVPISTKTIQITSTDRNGYKRKASITISSLIKVSDTEICQSTWKSMGGSDALPIISGRFYNYYGSSGQYNGTEYSGDNAVALFGKISFSNATPDFAAGSFTGQSCEFNLYTTRDSYDMWGTYDYSYYEIVSSLGNGLFYATQYGDALEVYAFRSRSEIARPKMDSNNWGPVPFMIVIDDIHTPNNPAGVVDYDNLYLGFCGQGNEVITKFVGEPFPEYFQITKLEKSWSSPTPTPVPTTEDIDPTIPGEDEPDPLDTLYDVLPSMLGYRGFSDVVVTGEYGNPATMLTFDAIFSEYIEVSGRTNGRVCIITKVDNTDVNWEFSEDTFKRPPEFSDLLRIKISDRDY